MREAPRRPARAARRLALLMVGALLLAACSQTQLALHTAKRISKAGGRTDTLTGTYKVGNPYQIGKLWYYPKVDYGYDETGIASWYGPNFHGKPTANGAVYDMNQLTAAHRTLPMPSMIQVTNLENGRSLRLKVNDRGPFARGRILDVSRRGAQLLGFIDRGTARVRVRILPDASRMLARQLETREIERVSGLPIKRAIRAGKPRVESETLAPPPGARARTAAAAGAPRNDRVVAARAPAATDATRGGTVTQGPARATRLYVQAGAFTLHENAFRAAVKIDGSGDVKVTSVMVDGREFFRVRSGPIRTVEMADRILDYVIRVGYPGAQIVVD